MKLRAQHQNTLVDSAPIFILSTARSGSTLLRAILNAHSQIACPPESNLVAAFESAAFTIRNTVGSDSTLVDACRSIASASLGEYARREGKIRWCDKSLYSLENVPILRSVFPNAQFICLYRDPLDTIASLLEASRWGYSSYGLEPYIRAQPGNVVNACAALWVEKIERLLYAEQELGDLACRLRYETLVLHPCASVERLCRWLSVEWEPAMVDPGSFLPTKAGPEVGDYKLRYSAGFDRGSIGRGWRIPTELISEDLFERIEEINAVLGYRPLKALERLVSDAVQQGEASSANRNAAERIMISFSARIEREGRNPVPTRAIVGIVVVDQGSTWRIDPSTQTCERGDIADSACIIVTDSETLAGLAHGTQHAGSAMREARLRILDCGLHDSDQLLAVLDWFIDLVRSLERDGETAAFDGRAEKQVVPLLHDA